MTKLIINNVKFTRSVGTASTEYFDNQPVGLPVIDGAQIENSTISVNITGVSDADGINNITYQWYKNEVPTVTGTSITLGDADVGAVYRVTMSYTDGNGFNYTLSSASTSPIANVNDVPSGIPTIVGTIETGQTVSVNTSGISDNDGLGAFTYQWLRNGSTISGATNASYTIQSADGDQLLSVKVSWTDGHGTAEYVVSTQNAVSVAFETSFVTTMYRNYYGTGDNDMLSLGSDLRRSLDFHSVYVAMGSSSESSSYGSNVGVVHLFNANGTFIRTIQNPGGSEEVGDYFGSSVDMSAGKLIVGAPTGGLPTNSGIAYVFNLSNGSLFATINCPYTQNSQNFGSGVAISGQYIAVGSPSYDLTYTANGRVALMNTSGTLISTIENPEPGTNKYFGFTCKIEGSYVVATANGRIHCFDLSGTHLWSNAGNLRSVGMSSTYTATISGESTTGSVRIYDNATGSLIRTISNPNSNTSSTNDFFGSSIDIYGNYILIGAAWERDTAGSGNSGVAYVFDISTGELKETIQNPGYSNSNVGDQFGLTCAWCDLGGKLVIGAPYEDASGTSSSGAVHLFSYVD